MKTNFKNYLPIKWVDKIKYKRALRDTFKFLKLFLILVDDFELLNKTLMENKVTC